VTGYIENFGLVYSCPDCGADNRGEGLLVMGVIVSSNQYGATIRFSCRKRGYRWQQSSYLRHRRFTQIAKRER
jgi:hypothetical protein